MTKATPKDAPSANPNTSTGAKPSPSANPRSGPGASPSASRSSSPNADPNSSACAKPSPNANPEATPRSGPGASPDASPDVSPGASRSPSPNANPKANSSASAKPSPSANPSAAAAAFLAPLARLAARHPGLEGQVLWAAEVQDEVQDGWQVQDDTAEMLDAEEIAFYVEGLLIEGFGLLWQAMAEAGGQPPDHILLMVWQPGTTPPPAPDPAEGWVIAASGHWNGTPQP